MKHTATDTPSRIPGKRRTPPTGRLVSLRSLRSGLILSSLLLALLPRPTLADKDATNPPDDLDVAISRFVPDRSERDPLLAACEERIGRGAAEIAVLAGADAAAVGEVLRREILANLKEKIDLRGAGLGDFPLNHQEILTTVVGYEVFKMRSYLSSGVFPKRYFGYVDRKWDTAEKEDVFLVLVRDAVAAINGHQEEKGRRVRLSDIEVLVTYLSEGGALFFREERHLIEEEEPGRIDLAFHLGCDNAGVAIERYEDLVRRLDRRFGTRLSGSARREWRGETGDRAVGIGRRVGFRESIVATAVMYLYEKEIAAEKFSRRKTSGDPNGWTEDHLMALPLSEQFVVSSLVFNTGILFSRDWVESIREFRTIRR
ncbi:MAG: hypothetical protein ABIH26_06640, partial [Candidatus Eisenbacteria bacterium]